MCEIPKNSKFYHCEPDHFFLKKIEDMLMEIYEACYKDEEHYKVIIEAFFNQLLQDDKIRRSPGEIKKWCILTENLFSDKEQVSLICQKHQVPIHWNIISYILYCSQQILRKPLEETGRQIDNTLMKQVDFLVALTLRFLSDDDLTICLSYVIPKLYYLCLEMGNKDYKKYIDLYVDSVRDYILLRKNTFLDPLQTEKLCRYICRDFNYFSVIGAEEYCEENHIPYHCGIVSYMFNTVSEKILQIIREGETD